MIFENGNEEFELFSTLSKRLQNYLRSNKIEKALKVAQKRHSVLVSLLENASLMGSERLDYALKAKSYVDIEQGLAKSNTSADRSNFLCRKNAFKAYGMYRK